MFIVYKHINRVNGKVYIGYTANGVDERWRGHCYAASSGEELVFSHAIRKYGVDAFAHDVLETCATKQQACEVEIRLIAEHNTMVPHGYNMTHGGERRVGEWNPMAKLTEDDVLTIKNTWNTLRLDNADVIGDFYRRFAQKLSVTADLICQIIKGRLWSHVGPELVNVNVSHRGKGKAAGEKMKQRWADAEFHEVQSLKRRGENNGRSVVTEDIVRALRLEFDQLDTSTKGVTKSFCVKHGERLGVTSENIYGIVKRKSWKNVV